ncbi:MAG TPA: hypothetical protein PLO32_07405, partial [Chitinophagales bacterium]|nr:hypothetical protein [Chitinophagales bacterium]
YKSDVVSAMLRFRYYKMGEIMKLIAEKIKQSDLSGNYEENIASLLKHMEMKKKQQDLAKEIQSVIHPS